MLKRIADFIRKNKAINYNLGYILSLGTYAKALFARRQAPQSKFVIYSSGRSGSTLLVSLLDSHSQVFCDNEIYHRKVVGRWTYLRLRSQMGQKPVYGFKLLTYHMGATLGMPQQGFNGYLRQLHEQGYKIIYLRRANVFRQALSNLYARQKNQFHNQGQSESKSKIRVNIAELDRWMQGLNREATLEQEYLKGIPHLSLSYERHLSDPEKQAQAWQDVCAFLEIPYEAPRTALRKNTPKSLESFIENHEEVNAFLQQSELARLAEQY